MHINRPSASDLIRCHALYYSLNAITATIFQLLSRLPHTFTLLVGISIPPMVDVSQKALIAMADALSQSICFCLGRIVDVRVDQ